MKTKIEIRHWAVPATALVNRYAAEKGCGQPPPGEEGGEKKNPAVLSGKSCELDSYVCVARRFIAEARKASMHAQYGRRRGITSGNRSESALIMYAVRIAGLLWIGQRLPAPQDDAIQFAEWYVGIKKRAVWLERIYSPPAEILC